MSREASLEWALCETNVPFLFILRPYDFGLVYDALVNETSTIERASVFGAVTFLFSFNAVAACVTIDDIDVMTLNNGLHILVQL